MRTLDLLNTVQALSAPGSCYAKRVGAAFPALSPARGQSGGSSSRPVQEVLADQPETTRSDAAQRSSTCAAADSSAQAVGTTAATANGADPPVYVGDAYYAAKDLLIRVRRNSQHVALTIPRGDSLILRVRGLACISDVARVDTSSNV